MTRGGARNRSGPAPDPTSGRSERRQYKLTALPAAGYDGDVPEYPLPQLDVFVIEFDDEGHRRRVADPDASAGRFEREQELWAWAWSTPQACAWSTAPWRHHTVAMWVRTAALCESPDAKAADKASLHRFGDQIGLTPAGMRENGWAIADDAGAKTGGTKTESSKTTAPAETEPPQRRLRVVPDAAA